MQLETKVIRWKKYFVNLLNCAIPDDPIPYSEYQKAEPCVNDLKLKDVEAAILRLNNWKAPGLDKIATELIKFGSKKLHESIYKVCQEICNEAIIIFAITTEVDLLNSVYKVSYK